MRRLFAVEGLACAGCAHGLERRLGAQPGMRLARVHYLTASALLDWDETLLTQAEVAGRVAGAGYRLIERHRPEELQAMLGAEMQRLGIRLAVAVLSGMWSMALALVLYTSELPATEAWWFALASGLFALPVLWAGRGILWMGWKSLQLRDPGMDLLVSLGVVGSMVLSVAALLRGRAEVWFDTATMLLTLLLLARLIDALTRRSALTALVAMQAAAPEIATVEEDGQRRRLPAAEVRPGARVIVDAGEAATVDGVVEAGHSQVDRAVLTGESRPVAAGPGDRVEAGCINLDRRLILCADREPGDRAIDRLGGAIALEIARGGAGGGMAERWSARLAWAIPALALAAVPLSLLRGLPPDQALLTGLAVLAGLCPCALTVAVPLARLRVAQAAATRGLRIREPEAFERLAEARAVVLDKTGTLTAGRPQLIEVQPAAGHDRAEVLTAAARAETGLSHPLARAIVAAAGEVGPGGCRAARHAEAVDPLGRVLRVGTASETEDGRTRLAVERDGALLGHLVLADAPLPEAAATVVALSRAGLAVHVASGDAEGPTRRLANALAIPPDRVAAGQTPQQKAALVRAIGPATAFVGDGVNDGPALAASACGIAVATAHAAARQTADLVIEQGGIERLPEILALSRKARRISAQGLALALIYNTALLPLLLAGRLTPDLAALAMAASSLSVMANALRLTGSRQIVPTPGFPDLTPPVRTSAP